MLQARSNHLFACKPMVHIEASLMAKPNGLPVPAGGQRGVSSNRLHSMPTPWRAVRQKRPAHPCASPSLFVPRPNGLSVFCHRTTARRQSATRSGLIGSLSFGNLRTPATHGFAINHQQPAVAACAATARRSNTLSCHSKASRPSQPMWSAIALSPGAFAH